MKSWSFLFFDVKSWLFLIETKKYNAPISILKGEREGLLKKKPGRWPVKIGPNLERRPAATALRSRGPKGPPGGQIGESRKLKPYPNKYIFPPNLSPRSRYPGGGGGAEGEGGGGAAAGSAEERLPTSSLQPW